MIAQMREARPIAWATVVGSAVRAAFGLVWAFDAFLKWQPAFADHYVGYLRNAAIGQPDWLQPWFAFWLEIVAPNVTLFVWATRIIETAIAVALVLGLARRWTYIVGIIYSLLIWSTAEGFGGPYTTGATNIGPGIVYVLVFVALGDHSGAQPGIGRERGRNASRLTGHPTLRDLAQEPVRIRIAGDVAGELVHVRDDQRFALCGRGAADALAEEIDWPTPYWWVDIGKTTMVLMLAAPQAGRGVPNEFSE